MSYTYDDFVSAANSAGLLKQFTQSDLQIAQKSPEFGLSMLGILKDGNSATTAEQKLLATEAANQLRKTYGSFGEGTGYSGTYDTQIKDLIDKSNNYGTFQYSGQNAYQQALDKVANYGDFQYGGQSAYDQALDKLNNYGSFQYGGQNAYQQALDKVTNYGDFQYGGQSAYDQTLDKLNNYGSFQYGGQNAYQQALDKVANYGDFQYGGETAYQKLLNSVINPESFQYDPEADPTWSAYKKASLREGERASANALAQASAASGGKASSYALTAAQQAANYYAAQLGDMLPTLQQNAYQQYLSEFEKKLSSLGAMESDRSFEYQQFLNGLSQAQGELSALQSDRNTNYEEWMNGYNMLQNNLSALQSDRNFDYQAHLNGLSQAQGALSALQSDRNTNYEEWMNGYNMLQNNLSALQSDRNFDYQAHLNGLSQAQGALSALQSDRNTNYEEWLNRYEMLQTALGNLQKQDQTEYQRYLNALDMANQSQAESYDRAYQLQKDKLQQEQQAYENEQAQQKYADQQAQQKYANALALYEVLGYATPEIAQVLGIPAGTLQEKPAKPGLPAISDKEELPGTPNKETVTLTDAQIRELQNFLGVEDDGIWGPNSSSAAGGLSAEDAWTLYQQLITNPQPEKKPTVPVTGNAGTSGLMGTVGGMKDKVLASTKQESTAGGSAGVGTGEVQNDGNAGAIDGRYPTAPVNKMNADNRVLVEGKYLTWTEILEGVSNGTIKEEYDASTGQYRYVYARGKGTAGNQATSSMSKKNLTTMHTR